MTFFAGVLVGVGVTLGALALVPAPPPRRARRPARLVLLRGGKGVA